MTLLRISLMVVCLAASNLLGQTVQFVDDSPNESAVFFHGTITFPANPDNATCEVTGHNNSTKAIVAYVLERKITKPTGETSTGQWIFDSFFKQSNIAYPQADFPVMTSCRSGLSIGHRFKTAPPDAHIRPLFIQYEDGSVWGEDKTISDVMFERTETLKYIQSLRDAYSSGGDYALYQALQAEVRWDETDHRHRFMLGLTRHTLLKLNNAKAAADAIDKDLATAEEHTAWLR